MVKKGKTYLIHFLGLILICKKYVEELIAIPIEEYEHLKRCEEQLNSIYESMQAILRNDIANAQIQNAIQNCLNTQPLHNQLNL